MVSAGVERARIRVGAVEDETVSLEAEVREETTRAFVAPQAGVVYPKETVKAGVVFGGPLTVVGAVVGAVAGVAAPIEWPLWLRALLGAISGAAALAAVAAIVVPAMSVKNPLDPSPAETGTTLRVTAPTDQVERMLVTARPQRLDRVDDDDRPLTTVVTEAELSEGGIVEEVVENFAREHRAAPEDRTR